MDKNKVKITINSVFQGRRSHCKFKSFALIRFSHQTVDDTTGE